MNFAVIGLGSFGIKRASAVNDSKQAKLKYIYDVDDENAKKASEKLGVPIKNYDEILNDKEIEVICVCTANKFHKEIIMIVKKRKTCFLRETLCTKCK